MNASGQSNEPIWLVCACSSIGEFIQAFRRYIDRQGLFVPTTAPLPANKQGRVALTLCTGEIVIEGHAEVVAASLKPAGLHGRAGMTLRFSDIDPASTDFMTALEKARFGPKDLAIPATLRTRPCRMATVPAAAAPAPGSKLPDPAQGLAECVVLGDLGSLVEAPRRAKPSTMPPLKQHLAAAGPALPAPSSAPPQTLPPPAIAVPLVLSPPRAKPPTAPPPATIGQPLKSATTPPGPTTAPSLPPATRLPHDQARMLLTPAFGVGVHPASESDAGLRPPAVSDAAPQSPADPRATSKLPTVATVPPARAASPAADDFAAAADSPTVPQPIAMDLTDRAASPASAPLNTLESDSSAPTIDAAETAPATAKRRTGTFLGQAVATSAATNATARDTMPSEATPPARPPDADPTDELNPITGNWTMALSEAGPTSVVREPVVAAPAAPAPKRRSAISPREESGAVTGREDLTQERRPVGPAMIEVDPSLLESPPAGEAGQRAASWQPPRADTPLPLTGNHAAAQARPSNRKLSDGGVGFFVDDTSRFSLGALPDRPSWVASNQTKLRYLRFAILALAICALAVVVLFIRHQNRRAQGVAAQPPQLSSPAASPTRPAPPSPAPPAAQPSHPAATVALATDAPPSPAPAPAPVPPDATVQQPDSPPTPLPVSPAGPTKTEAECYASVTSVPPGAQVVSGKTVVGVTPAVLTLPCRPTTLVFRKAGAPAVTKQLTPASQRPSEPSFVARFAMPKLATLKVTSTPSGASVEIGKRKSGKTPLNLKLPVNSHVSVTVSKPGYVTKIHNITVRERGAAINTALTKKLR